VKITNKSNFSGVFYENCTLGKVSVGKEFFEAFIEGLMMGKFE
jgi:hypothetical protein